MGTSLPGVDVVDEGEDVLAVAFVVLEGTLKLDTIAQSLKIDWFLVDGLFILTEKADKAFYSALKDEFFRLFLGQPLIFDDDFDSLVEKGELPQPLGEYVEAEIDVVKNLYIGLEAEDRSPAACFTHHRHGDERCSPFIFLMIDLSFAVHKYLAPFGEGVYDRNTHTMQSARYLVGILVELTSGMETGKDYFQGAYPLSLMEIHGNTASVVLNTDNVAFFYNDVNFITMTGKSFIDTVIDNFVDKMV